MVSLAKETLHGLMLGLQKTVLLQAEVVTKNGFVWCEITAETWHEWCAINFTY